MLRLPLPHTELEAQRWVPALRGQRWPVFIIARSWLEAQGPVLPVIFEVQSPQMVPLPPDLII